MIRSYFGNVFMPRLQRLFKIQIGFLLYFRKMSGIDVFVGNYPVIDWDLYSLWVEGTQSKPSN